MYTAEALKSFRSHDSYALYLAAHVQTVVYHVCMWCIVHVTADILNIPHSHNISRHRSKYFILPYFIHKNYVLFLSVFIYLCECLVCVSHVNSVIISFSFF